jgi:hypothetical protein
MLNNFTCHHHHIKCSVCENSVYIFHRTYEALNSRL